MRRWGSSEPGRRADSSEVNEMVDTVMAWADKWVRPHRVLVAAAIIANLWIGLGWGILTVLALQGCVLLLILLVVVERDMQFRKVAYPILMATSTAILVWSAVVALLVIVGSAFISYLQV
jgi:hypothetical protein